MCKVCLFPGSFSYSYIYFFSLSVGSTVDWCIALFGNQLLFKGHSFFACSYMSVWAMQVVCWLFFFCAFILFVSFYRSNWHIYLPCFPWISSGENVMCISVINISPTFLYFIDVSFPVDFLFCVVCMWVLPGIHSLLRHLHSLSWLL